jgi:hypothetical protein
LSSDSPTLLADTSYSYRAHYNGDSTHTASDGPCEPLDPTTPTVPVPSPAEVSAEGVQVSPAAVQVSPATAVQASPALTG